MSQSHSPEPRFLMQAQRSEMTVFSPGMNPKGHFLVIVCYWHICACALLANVAAATLFVPCWYLSQ